MFSNSFYTTSYPANPTNETGFFVFLLGDSKKQIQDIPDFLPKNPLLKFIKLANDDSSKKTLDENRRGDSLDADRISKLYNLDVNKNGKRNITQEAHPEMLVAFPSYDKINGVIKNDNEKQDLTINILNGQFTTSLINL